MLKRKLSALIALVLIVASAPTRADNAGAAFLLIPGDMRAVALGSTGTAEVGYLGSLDFNPAGLGFREEAVLGAGFTRWLAETNLGHLAGCLPIDNLGSLSLGVKYMSVGGFGRRTGDTPEPIGEFDALGLLGEVGYARELFDGFSAGVDVGVVHQRLDTYSATGAVLDAGVLYRTPLEWLDVGAAVRNLGTPLVFIEEETALPTSLGAGVSLGFLDGDLNANIEGEYYLDDAEDTFFAHLGAEYIIARTAAVRAGYTYGNQSQHGGLAGLSAGLGVMLSGFVVDFAYANHGELGYSLRGSLGYDFGFVAGRVDELEAYLQRLQERIDSTSRAFYAEGRDAMSMERYDEAASSFDKALIWDPNYTEAAEAYERAENLARIQAVEEHLEQGNLWLRIEDYVAALASFNAALELNPENEEAAERADFAARALAKQLAEREAHVSELSTQAAEAYSSGDYKVAVDLWGEVLRLDPDNPQAEGYYNQARKHLNDQIDNLFRRAESLEDQQRYAEALGVLYQAQELVPDDPVLSTSISRLRGLLSQQVNGLVDKGVALHEAGDHSRAEDTLTRALRLDPDNSRAADYLERARDAQRVDEPQTDPIAANEYYLQGINAYTRRDYEQAIYYWEKCLEFQPDHDKARANIARAKQMLAALEE